MAKTGSWDLNFAYDSVSMLTCLLRRPEEGATVLRARATVVVCHSTRILETELGSSGKTARVAELLRAQESAF